MRRAMETASLPKAERVASPSRRSSSLLIDLYARRLMQSRLAEPGSASRTDRPTRKTGRAALGKFPPRLHRLEAVRSGS